MQEKFFEFGDFFKQKTELPQQCSSSVSSYCFQEKSLYRNVLMEV